MLKPCIPFLCCVFFLCSRLIFVHANRISVDVTKERVEKKREVRIPKTIPHWIDEAISIIHCLFMWLLFFSSSLFTIKWKWCSGFVVAITDGCEHFFRTTSLCTDYHWQAVFRYVNMLDNTLESSIMFYRRTIQKFHSMDKFVRPAPSSGSHRNFSHSNLDGA